MARLLTLTLMVIIGQGVAGAERIELTRAEHGLAVALAGWPAARVPDDSNRGSGHPLAIAAGARLFFTPSLSANRRIACATCHVPELGYTDRRRTAVGLAPLPRNAPTVIDTRWQRWFGWGGAHDNLWAQSLKALVTPTEMGATANSTRAWIEADPQLVCALESAFDVDLENGSDEDVLVLAAKSLAAFQETLVSPPSAFDRFAEALREGDEAAASRYPDEALAGYRLFVGEGRCHLCHAGVRFTNDEFASAAVPHFTPDGADKGRFAGLTALRASPFTRAGPHSDAPDSPRARFARLARMQPDLFGAFKVPSLRNLAHTAPYMHDGSLPTLEAVVEHYSTIDEQRIHDPRNSLLRPLRLTASQASALVAFLRSLSAPLPPDEREAHAERLAACGA